MSREIKFRGLTKDGNPKWVYGNLHIINYDNIILYDHDYYGKIIERKISPFKCAWILEPNSPSSSGWSISDSFHAKPINPDSVGQFTGLKDKNGTDIYEGDIIQLYRHDDREHHHIKSRVWVNGVYKDDIKEVKFMFGSFVIWSDLIKDYRCFANLARPGESLEVIGNRFQNPELL